MGNGMKAGIMRGVTSCNWQISTDVQGNLLRPAARRMSETY